MVFKLLHLYSNFTLTLGYLNPALNNPVRIIFFILKTFFLDNVLIMLGENWRWSLLGRKGLIGGGTDRWHWTLAYEGVDYFRFTSRGVMISSRPPKQVCLRLLLFIKQFPGFFDASF